VGFTVEDRHVRHISCRSFLVIVLTESKDMPISRAIVCLWFIFLAECETLNFVDVGRRTWTVWMTIIARCRLKELMLPVMPIIFLSFHSINFNIPPSTVQKHLTHVRIHNYGGTQRPPPQKLTPLFPHKKWVSGERVESVSGEVAAVYHRA